MHSPISLVCARAIAHEEPEELTPHVRTQVCACVLSFAFGRNDVNTVDGISRYGEPVQMSMRKFSMASTINRVHVVWT